MAQGNYEERLQKLFVGGLNRSTEDETVKSYFEKYGELTDCIVIKDQSKNSRGFGYVTFADYRCTFQVLQDKKENGHTIDEKAVEVKRAIPRDDSNTNPVSHTKTTKIFLGGIKKEAEESDIREAVEKVLEGYGSIVGIDMIREKESGEFRGFGFIELDSNDSVDTVCCVKNISIKGKRAEAKKAEPKNKEGGGGGGRGRSSGRGSGRGGGNMGMSRGGGGFDSSFGAGTQNMFGAGNGSYGAPGAYSPYAGAMGAYGGYNTGGYDNYGAMGNMYNQNAASNFGPQNAAYSGGRGGGRYKPY